MLKKSLYEDAECACFSLIFQCFIRGHLLSFGHYCNGVIDTECQGIKGGQK